MTSPLFSAHRDSLSSQDSMALTTELGRQLQLREVGGILLQAATVDNWSEIQHFEAKPDDLLICTYPKSGDCRAKGTARPRPAESAGAAHLS